MLEVYADPAAPACGPVLLFIADCNLRVTVKTVHLCSQERLRSDFYHLNPNQSVPLLRQGDFVLTETSTILKFLADLFLSATYPADFKERARVNEWLDWFNRLFLFDYVYGLVYSRLSPGFDASVDSQQTRLVRHEQRAKRHLSALNSALETGPFLLGDITLADYLGACLVVLGEMTDIPLADYPNLARWLARMKQRPAWDKAQSGFSAQQAAFTHPAAWAT